MHSVRGACCSSRRPTAVYTRVCLLLGSSAYGTVVHDSHRVSASHQPPHYMRKHPLPPPPPRIRRQYLQAALDYTLARKIDRYQAQDVMSGVFENFVELSGDGKVSDDFCLKGGLARMGGVSVVVMGTVKGHTPGDMKSANYGECCGRRIACGWVGGTLRRWESESKHGFVLTIDTVFSTDWCGSFCDTSLNIGLASDGKSAAGV